MARRWPDTLPGVEGDALGFTPVDGVLRTNLQGQGLLNTRVVSREELDTFSVVWEFSDAQMALFRAFHESAAWSVAGDSDQLGWTVTNANATWMTGGPEGEAYTQVKETTTNG